MVIFDIISWHHIPASPLPFTLGYTWDINSLNEKWICILHSLPMLSIFMTFSALPVLPTMVIWWECFSNWFHIKKLAFSIALLFLLWTISDKHLLGVKNLFMFPMYLFPENDVFRRWMKKPCYSTCSFTEACQPTIYHLKLAKLQAPFFISSTQWI